MNDGIVLLHEELAGEVSSEDSYDSDEPPPRKPDLDKLLSHVSQFVKRQLSSARRLTRGRYHEIYALYSSDEQWSCVARLSRSPESISKLSSEVATMKYVHIHTQIPVPEVYCYDFSSGMQFIAMERMPGRHLYQIWDHLTMDHKKVALGQIARVLGQLAQLKFSEIGSLQEDFKVGPLLRMDHPADDLNLTTLSSGPFASTFEYLASFLEAECLHHGDVVGKEADSILSDVRRILREYCTQHDHSSSIHPPFRLCHADFDGQNMLFTDPRLTNGDPPRLTGVIDWEYAHTAPLYFLYEYPIFIQDNDRDKGAYATNAILRPYFLRELRSQFPQGSAAYMEAKETMAAKCSTLSTFHDLFIFCMLEWNLLEDVVLEYMREEANGTGKPYRGRADWVPDPELDTKENESVDGPCGSREVLSW